MRLVVLAGGVGAARFLSGLVKVADPGDITVIVNTGDDLTQYGLYISPDVDIVMYTLAGIVHAKQGWGLEGDTFACLQMLKNLGHDTWFNLGDRDLAVHIHRSARLSQGWSLSEITNEIRRQLDLKIRILPMSDQRVTTKIDTGKEVITFQEYLVQRRAQDPVRAISFDGVREASPAPGVLEAIREAEGIILAPSNPLVSIGTILALPGIRRELIEASAAKIAISPIVEGRTIKGPADLMMGNLGYEVSALGVAELYKDFLRNMVIDRRDAKLKEAIESLGLRVMVTDTIMRNDERKQQLALDVLGMLEG